MAEIEQQARPSAYRISGGGWSVQYRTHEDGAFRLAKYERRGECEIEPLYSRSTLDAAVAAERERCIAECKAVAEDVTDAAKMGALECWRRLALVA